MAIGPHTDTKADPKHVEIKPIETNDPNELKKLLAAKTAECERLTNELAQFKPQVLPPTDEQLRADNKRLKEEVAHLRHRAGI